MTVDPRFADFFTLGDDVDQAQFDLWAQSMEALLLTKRERLSGPRTYYVRPDGNDSNDGGANTSVSAFLTKQKAMDVIASDLDLGNNDVTVQVAPATYTAGLRCKSYVSSAGIVKFLGDPTTPSNVYVNPAVGPAIFTNGALDSGVFEFTGFKVSSTTAGTRDGVRASGRRVYFRVNAIEFGNCTSTQCQSIFGAHIEAVGNLLVSGGAAVGFWASRQALLYLSNRTITYSNNPAYSARNFNASEAGWLDCFSMIFTNGGTVTGKRYQADNLGGIFTNGGGASYVPGNSAGSESEGGEYI